MQKLIEILKLLESAVPAPDKCHHVLMYAKFGSDEAGWKDRLLLQINKDGKFHPFFFDEEDMEKTPADLVGAIVDLLNQPPPATWQVSEIAGKAGSVPVAGELSI